MKLSWKVDPAGLRYVLEDEAHDSRIPPSDWHEVNANPAVSAGLLLLHELLENGQADADEEGVCIPHEEVTALEEIDQRILELPEPYPFDIRVDAKGTLDQKAFTYDLGYYAHIEGERVFFERHGCLLVQGERQYLLSGPQLTLCQKVDAFNALPQEQKGMVENLLAFAELKVLSENAQVALDRYLQDQEVYHPEKVQLDLERDGDALVIHAGVEGTPGFAEKFERRPVRATYTFQKEDGKRKRVVFSPEQQEALVAIKARSRYTGQDREALLENPQAFFDPDVIDLEAFSDRVVEIGFYKPKFYPFISPYKSEWIPGFIIETSPEERKQVTFTTTEELNRFDEARREALAKGKATMSWEDVEIPMAEANRIVTTARRQLASPGKPIKKGEGGQQKQVLIIAENVEEIGYTEGLEVPTAETFEHSYTPPPFLRAGITPRKHQEEGIAWLQSLSKQYPGALLADDMGLGKTLIVLAFLKWHALHPAYDTGPYLVVAPVSLLENWENEHNKFFEPSPPPVTRLYGPALKGMLQEGREGVTRHLSQPQLCLTTYETLRRQQLVLGAIDWAVVVLDEAQKVKTPGTLVTNAAKALKADFKIAMTGTPVENTLIDLWCIIDFAVPGLLGSAKEFARMYQHPLKDADVNVRELGESLRKRLGFYIKRRLKQDVLDELPKKHIHVCPRQMPAVQRDRYMIEVHRVQQARTGEGMKGTEVLKALHAMRAISDHPFLLDRQLDRYPLDDLIAASAKLQETVNMLENIKVSEEKAILFADQRATQRMLARVLKDRLGIHPSIINGSTPAGKRSGRSAKLTRQETINRFEEQQGFNAIIMSPLAAGVGLNVTTANHVIHYARHWNPAKEDQATDRAYRLGQEKEVHVYYPMATLAEFKSFDTILDELLSVKRNLAAASLFPTERVEVRPDELYRSVFDFDAAPTDLPLLTLEDADAMEPYLFEAFVAALLRKQGYDVLLTPLHFDRGADVVTFSSRENLLVQVKQTLRGVSNAAVQEITAAHAYYRQCFGETFTLVVLTNQTLTKPARELADANNVRIIDRPNLHTWIEANPVNLEDVRKEEDKRLVRL
jgi:SNF2 family DNA or RNA helicase